MRFMFVSIILCVVFGTVSGLAQDPKPAPVADPELAKKYGADERGMRKFVLVM